MDAGLGLPSYKCPAHSSSIPPALIPMRNGNILIKSRDTVLPFFSNLFRLRSWIHKTSNMALSRFSKENRWYYQDIDGHIKPESRRLLEEYSHIPSQDVDSHIYKLVPAPFLQSPQPIKLMNSLSFSATFSGPTPLIPVLESSSSWPLTSLHILNTNMSSPSSPVRQQRSPHPSNYSTLGAV